MPTLNLSAQEKETLAIKLIDYWLLLGIKQVGFDLDGTILCVHAVFDEKVQKCFTQQYFLPPDKNREKKLNSARDQGRIIEGTDANLIKSWPADLELFAFIKRHAKDKLGVNILTLSPASLVKDLAIKFEINNSSPDDINIENAAQKVQRLMQLNGDTSYKKPEEVYMVDDTDRGEEDLNHNVGAPSFGRKYLKPDDTFIDQELPYCSKENYMEAYNQDGTFATNFPVYGPDGNLAHNEQNQPITTKRFGLTCERAMYGLLPRLEIQISERLERECVLGKKLDREALQELIHDIRNKIPNFYRKFPQTSDLLKKQGFALEPAPSQRRAVPVPIELQEQAKTLLEKPTRGLARIYADLDRLAICKPYQKEFTREGVVVSILCRDLSFLINDRSEEFIITADGHLLRKNENSDRVTEIALLEAVYKLFDEKLKNISTLLDNIKNKTHCNKDTLFEFLSKSSLTEISSGIAANGSFKVEEDFLTLYIGERSTSARGVVLILDGALTAIKDNPEILKSIQQPDTAALSEPTLSQSAVLTHTEPKETSQPSEVLPQKEARAEAELSSNSENIRNSLDAADAAAAVTNAAAVAAVTTAAAAVVTITPEERALDNLCSNLDYLDILVNLSEKKNYHKHFSGEIVTLYGFTPKEGEKIFISPEGRLYKEDGTKAKMKEEITEIALAIQESCDILSNILKSRGETDRIYAVDFINRAITKIIEEGNKPNLKISDPKKAPLKILAKDGKEISTLEAFSILKDGKKISTLDAFSILKDGLKSIKGETIERPTEAGLPAQRRLTLMDKGGKRIIRATSAEKADLSEEQRRQIARNKNIFDLLQEFSIGKEVTTNGETSITFFFTDKAYFIVKNDGTIEVKNDEDERTALGETEATESTNILHETLEYIKSLGLTQNTEYEQGDFYTDKHDFYNKKNAFDQYATKPYKYKLGNEEDKLDNEDKPKNEDKLYKLAVDSDGRLRVFIIDNHHRDASNFNQWIEWKPGTKDLFSLLNHITKKNAKKTPPAEIPRKEFDKESLEKEVARFKYIYENLEKNNLNPKIGALKVSPPDYDEEGFKIGCETFALTNKLATGEVNSEETIFTVSEFVIYKNGNVSLVIHDEKTKTKKFQPLFKISAPDNFAHGFISSIATKFYQHALDTLDAVYPLQPSIRKEPITHGEKAGVFNKGFVEKAKIKEVYDSLEVLRISKTYKIRSFPDKSFKHLFVDDNGLFIISSEGELFLKRELPKGEEAINLTPEDQVKDPEILWSVIRIFEKNLDILREKIGLTKELSN